MRPSTVAAEVQRTVIRFPGPNIQVSRKTLEVLASALEDVRLFYRLSSSQVSARNETQRLLRGEEVFATHANHILSLRRTDEDS